MSEIIGKKVSLADLARENGRDNKRQKCPATSTKNLAIKDGSYYSIFVACNSSRSSTSRHCPQPPWDNLEA